MKNTNPQSSLIASDPDRFLASSLGTSLLGMDVTLDVYARNGFRLLGIPARADHIQTERALQRFRSMYRLSPERALAARVQTGYDAHVLLDQEDIKKLLSNLQDPRYRIISELFWAYVSDDLLEQLIEDEEAALSELRDTSNRSTGLDRALALHALATIYHNKALAHELVFAAGEAEGTDAYWQQALAHWAEIIASEVFWDYLRDRAAGFDHPNLQPDDITILREQLPEIILKFNARLAETYIRANQSDQCALHVGFIAEARLPESSKRAILSDLVKTVVFVQLEPLAQIVESELLAVSGKMSRSTFEETCSFVLEEAARIRTYLSQDLNLPPQTVEEAEFDSFTQLIVKALDSKIDYQTKERQRELLYSSQVLKKLLAFPLSPAHRRKIEYLVMRDGEHIYGDLLEKKQDGSNLIDHTKCWFMEDEEADPDASLIRSVYKITNREVQVDHLRQTGGIRVHYETRVIFVPRSTYAAAVHGGSGRKKPIQPVQPEAPSNPTAVKLSHGLAFLSSLMLSVIGVVGVFFLRRTVLPHIESRMKALPVEWASAGGFLLWLVLWLGFQIGITTVGFFIGAAALVGFWIVVQQAFKDAKDTYSGRLLRELVVKPHTATTIQGFPPFKKALSKGYKQGKEPTEFEMQMTESEKQEAVRRLGGMYYY